MPSVELFRAQDAAYRDRVLPPGGRTVTIEAGATFGWASVAGGNALHLGVDRFGLSAPYEAIQKELGLTPDQVAERIRSWLV